MTIEQFTALAQLIRLRAGASQRAAVMVFVEDASHADAMAETGLSWSGVSNVVRRCKAALELAKLAAGLPHDSKNSA